MMPGNAYAIKGGFTAQINDGSGRVSETTVVGDGTLLSLFDGASMLDLTLATGLLASASSLLI